MLCSCDEGERFSDLGEDATEEEKAEMRAAFGTGSRVVDIITGGRIRL